MTYQRTTVTDFALANPLYVNSDVTFWRVLNGEKTAQKATLYSAITGSSQLSNPQTLDSHGKFRQPVYIEEAVIMSIENSANAPDHETGVVVPPTLNTDFWSFFVSTVSNKEWELPINIPFACRILSITSKSESGTCTLTGKINGTPLGGDANAVSLTQQEETHADDNIIAIGDDFSMEVTDNASCENMSVTIKFTRT